MRIEQPEPNEAAQSILKAMLEMETLKPLRSYCALEIAALEPLRSHHVLEMRAQKPL